MPGGEDRSVVILYEHPLLGEGIARHVRTQTGVRTTVAAARDADAVSSALADEPSVVIYELSQPLPQGDIAALAPQAVLVDVSAAVTLGVGVAEPAPDLDDILRAVRDPFDDGCCGGGPRAQAG